MLGLITPREVGGVRSSDRAAMRAAGGRWPQRVRVIDWVESSADHSDWFGATACTSPRRAGAFARLVRGALAAAALMPRAEQAQESAGAEASPLTVRAPPGL